MAKKCTKVEKHFRIAQAVRLLSSGAVQSEVCRYAAKEWGLSERQGRQVVQDAREVIIADINQDRQEVVAELIHGARTVWKKAIEDKQYNNALGAMNLISRLGGLEPK